MRLVLCIALFGVLLGAGSAFSQTNDDTEFFETHVRPILVEHCFECHSLESEASGGLLLDSRESLFEGGDSGPAIELSSRGDSLLLRAIEYRDPKLQMPPDGKLSESQLQRLRQWIDAGAPTPTSFSRTNGVDQQSMALSVEQALTHWAYRPVERPPIPSASQPGVDASTITSPIDAFLSVQQLEQGISASSTVEFGTWIRRLSVDLHGLNPTYEDLQYWDERFRTSDDSQKALTQARVIDSMLASPRYGERFARRWMDVVRYAESLTLRGFLLHDVWRYRNYLIDAFNADLPIDQFIQEQIAGDLMNSESIAEAQRRQIATTGLVIGDHNYEEQDKLQLEMDIIDEQLETLGKAFLAQTLGCARCHDHKFDPIPTRDYYALAGILKSSISVEHENVSKWIRQPLPLVPEQEAAYLQASARKNALTDELNALRKALDPKPTSTRVTKSSEYQGVVVDDVQAKKIGGWENSTFSPEYVDQGYVHDGNQLKGEKTITFEPSDLPPGVYTVRMSYAHGGNRSSNTTVRVFSAEGESPFEINQRLPASDDGLWRTLGTFRFEAGGQAFVMISNEGSDGHVIADAIQFLPEGTPPKVPMPGENGPQARDAQATATMKERQKEIQAELDSVQKILDDRPMVQTLRPSPTPQGIPIHIRGSVHRLGAVVPRGFLSCINAHDPTLEERTLVAGDSNGRLELARWLTDKSNPLTARVYTNRVWAAMMGRGIAPTLDNFGTTGEPPSAPDLLDWLTTEFQNSDWSTKRLVRAIALSQAYRRESRADRRAMEKDPDNGTFARSTLRRLDAESLRDSLLQASEELDFRVGRASTIRPGTKEDYRYVHDTGLRSVFLPWFRNALPELIRDFDGANPSFAVASRGRSTVAPQALTMMHSPWIEARAQAAANAIRNRLGSTDAVAKSPTTEIIDAAFRSILARDPDTEERRWAESLLESESLEELAHQLFACLDFRYTP